MFTSAVRTLWRSIYAFRVRSLGAGLSSIRTAGGSLLPLSVLATLVAVDHGQELLERADRVAILLVLLALIVLGTGAKRWHGQIMPVDCVDPSSARQSPLQIHDPSRLREDLVAELLVAEVGLGGVPEEVLLEV